MSAGWTQLIIYIYIYINWITMTWKFGKHLHATYGTLNSCFDLIGSHQCIPWSPIEIEPSTTECRAETLPLGLLSLLWFYGISTIVDYLMPNAVFTNIWFVNLFCRYIQLNDQTLLFQTMQFSIIHLFAHSLNVKEFYLIHR